MLLTSPPEPVEGRVQEQVCGSESHLDLDLDLDWASGPVQLRVLVPVSPVWISGLRRRVQSQVTESG